tara:strand:+ start:107461 stop:108063 length:603 start_codon:yes stop_codon:yes gene_type:complete
MMKKRIMILLFGLIAFNLTAQISEVKLYPNPFSDEVTIDITSKKFFRADYAIQVYDIIGRVLIQQNGELIFGKNEIAFNTSSLPGNGVYIFSISSEGDTSLVKGVKRMTVGIEDAQEVKSPVVYPNPVVNWMNISNLKEQQDYKISIFNLPGQLVFEMETRFQSIVNLDLTSLKTATYFMRITDHSDRIIYLKKFQKHGL